MNGLTFRGATALVAAASFAVAAVVALVSADASASTSGLAPGTRFYVPGPNPAAQQQIARLTSSGEKADAARVAALASTAHAVWISGGSPNDARVSAQKTVNRAAGKNQLPVLALYNVPGRDCSGYSAGGATDLASYQAWIDGVAAGIGDRPAIVILEPDGLGLLPQSNCGSQDFTDADRYAELGYAVDTLGRGAATRVYLDATHSAWQSVGDAAQRLVLAGVERAAGFFLNVSNYQYASNEVFYGTWISNCIAYATKIAPGGFGACPNQYWDGGPATNWDGDALSPYLVWRNEPYSGDHADLAWNTVGIDSRWASMLGSTQPTTHFVVDTSRDGLGPWQTTVAYPDKQDWCNPPGRGAGPRPTADTGSALADAFLWVKVPGESDGSCNRGIPGATTDPEWDGIVDPAAGVWFPEQALQLAQLAAPPLVP
ncbi:MAG TPA: glycoside hydrolase family 6 protein [Gaiellaceae bacterium]|nr:glycoside hydrolase family 6 protein [Gaiellaceae bacterium]